LDQEDIDEVYEVEKNINFLNKSITGYMVKINQTTLPIEDLKSIGALFHVANDIERVGDHAENIADAAVQRKEQNIEFSREAMGEMGRMLDMVNDCYRYSVEMFAHGKDEHMQDIIDLEDRIEDMERELQQAHVERLKRNECTPDAGMIYSDILSGLERIADHAVNIAFSISESEQEG
ncbi:MAG: Na/Pi cotransporter family protein, partial [Lachnospiraceae bacterium]|nr:Na/Pi cotransporter family protein [Lachnospiraceae bacterium]